MSTTADIQKYGRHRDGYVEYFIKVVHNGRVYGIKKRFSEFVQLHEYLLKSGYNVPCSLPKKTKVWRKIDDKLLQKRSKALQVYLNELLKTFSVAENSLLKEFLEIEVDWMRTAKQRSFKQVQRLDSIPLSFAKWVIPLPVSRVKTSPFLRGGGGGHAGPALSSTSHYVASSSFAALNKTKSLSFSVRSPGRKESFLHDYSQPSPSPFPASMGRDRKFSTDLFGSFSALSVEHANTLNSAVKRSAFIRATEALWSHYAADVRQLCREGDEDVDFDSSFFACEETETTLERERERARENATAQGKARILTMASLTNSGEIDPDKVLRVLASNRPAQRESSKTQGIVSALVEIEKLCLSSPCISDPLGWAEEPLVVNSFDEMTS